MGAFVSLLLVLGFFVMYSPWYATQFGDMSLHMHSCHPNVV